MAAGSAELLEFLLRRLQLDPHRRVALYFEDGTGVLGFPVECANYLERRFRVFPNDTYEVERIDEDFSNTSFEIVLATFEGQSPKEDDRDPRF